MGSWGLPEFGITEWIGDRLGLQRSSSGGSQLAYSPQQLMTEQVYPTNISLNKSMVATQPTARTTSQVLGAADTTNIVNNPSGGGGGGGGGDGDSGGGQPSGPSQQEIDYQNMLNQLWQQQEQGYSDVTSSLGQQQGTMKTEAENQHQQGLKDIGASQAEQQALLDTQTRKTEEGQTKSLKSLAENVRNLMQAGNIYLGARGAGDSSAAGMWGYALGKEALKNKANVLQQVESIKNDIADREASLGRLVTQEKDKLQTSYNTMLNNISTWYSQAMQQVQQAKIFDKNALSQQVLAQALDTLNQAKTDFANKQTALQSWAISNSTGIDQLKSNLAAVTSQSFQQLMQPSMSLGGLTSGTNNATTYAPTGTTQEDYLKKLYGV